MKKMMMIAAGIMLAACLQAATLQWGVSGSLFASQGAQNDGDGWALPGTQVMLVYNGNAGSTFDGTWNGSAWEFNGTSTLVDSMTTTAADYGNGNAKRTISGVDMTYLGNTFTTWEQMNSMSFTVITVAGGYYNFANVTTVGFSTATGMSGSGSAFFSGALDAALLPIPEPTSMALLGIGVAVFALRRRAKK